MPEAVSSCDSLPGKLSGGTPGSMVDISSPSHSDLTDSSHFLSLSLDEARMASAIFPHFLDVSASGDCIPFGLICLAEQ